MSATTKDSYVLYSINNEEYLAYFIGKPQEIEKTINYYNNRDINVNLPFDRSKFVQYSSHEIFCFQPLFQEGNVVSISTHNINFEITMNAIKFVADQFKCLDKIKRGELYKFINGPHEISTFLPYDVAYFLHNYDWHAHREAYEKSALFKKHLIETTPGLSSRKQYFSCAQQ